MPKNVKITTHFNPLDLFAPHSCQGCDHIGTVLCNRCKKYILDNTPTICPKCKAVLPTHSTDHPCRLGFPVYSIGERSGLLDQIIHAYKYDSIRALAMPLAELLNAHLPEDLAESSVIVPLPTATHHIRARGFDHTLLLAKKLAHLRHVKIGQPLVRNKNTVQVGASKVSRLSQAASAYEIAHNAIINKETTYILLDDVWTTGASMTAAVQKLRAAGAEHIIAAVLSISSQ